MADAACKVRPGSVGALEAGGDVLAAVVEDEAEGDGQGQVDAQEVEVQRRAQAQRRLQVRQPLDQRAARLHRRAPQGNVQQPQHVRAHPQLQRVQRALGAVSAPTVAAATVSAATIPTSTVSSATVPTSTVSDRKSTRLNSSHAD